MGNNTDANTRPSYEQVEREFTLRTLESGLSGDVENAVNACVECCDRHVGENRIALRCVSLDQNVTEYTFEELRDMSARAANVFADHGVGPGDVVAGLLPRTVELVTTILAAWRLGAVYQPLFTAFGPKAIEHRLKTSKAKLIVTNSANRFKLNEIDTGARIAVVTQAPDTLIDGDIDYRAALNKASNLHEPVKCRGEDLFLLMSTSGTVGLPKGVPVPLRALLAFAAYMRFGIGIRDDDIFWNLADPGWAYGLYYTITGPLLLGRSTILNEAGFGADATFQLIDRLGVTSLAGSPTAFRLLMAAGAEAARSIKGKLRTVSSAGEPLNPEVIRWFQEHLEAPLHDHYGQTELGMVVNNHHGLVHAIHPGSAGLAMPGYRVAVLGPDGNELSVKQTGVLAVDVSRSPLLWFRGYLDETVPAISDGYYRTGDMVELGDNGSVFFVGRADDIITSSGYRIGPFDVESALVEHPAVTEAAVIGVPDPERTEIVKAFVVLANGISASPALAEELSMFVKTRLSAHAFPRAIEFVTELPKTPSGKIQRFILRKSEIDKLDSEQGKSA